MELTLFSAIGTTLKTTQEILGIALQSRDLVKNAPLFQQLNTAQQSVLSLTAQLFELQNKYLEAAQELAKLKESLIERDRYALTEITKGVFVLKSREIPAAMDIGHERTAEPEHFICQPCLNIRGNKIVLQQSQSGWGPIYLECPACKGQFPTGEVRHLNMPIIGQRDFP